MLSNIMTEGWCHLAFVSQCVKSSRSLGTVFSVNWERSTKSVSKPPDLAILADQLQIDLTSPNVSVVLHIFCDSFRDGGLSCPRPTSDQQRRNSDVMSVTSEQNPLRGYDSLPSTNFVRLCAMNLTSTNVLHFVTASFRPGSALTGV